MPGAWLTLRRGLMTTLALVLLLGGLAPLPAAHALDAPLPLAPADGAVTTIANYPPLGIPDFEWSAVTGATTYRLQYSQDVGFAVKQEVTTDNTRYTPIDASKLPDGLWYWRVRVEVPGPPGAYSAIMTFTKQWAAAANAPALVSPAEGATLDFYDAPAFAWQPVTGAASYRLQIAASPDGFSAPRYNQTTLATTHQPPAKLANGAYYWRVIPLDAAGREGAASAVRGFTASYNRVPVPLAPEDNATPTFTPAFRWTAVRGAELYRLQYATDPAFYSGVTTVDTRNTAYTPSSELSNDVNYYWRVRAHAGAAIADWSPTRQFRKQWYLQPELLTPVNNYQFVSDPLFSWTPVPGAASYRFELHCVNSFPATSQCGWIVETTNPFYSLRPEGNKWTGPATWYWRVTPIDGSNGLGQASPASSYVYSPTVLAPQLVSPLYYYPPPATLQPHEDRTVSLPIFTWHRTVFSDTQAAAYRVQVDDDPLFRSPDWSFDTQNQSAAPTTDVPFAPAAGRDYYWRVRVLDRMGGNLLGEWSQRWRTRIDLQGCQLSESWQPCPTVAAAPTLLRPADAAEFVETAPLLEWWPLADTGTYEVQISSDASFATDIVESATVPYPAYTPRGRLAYGTYYWRVRSAGGAWSAVGRFQVAAQSRWRETRTLGAPLNRQQIAADPAGDMTDGAFDLTDLSAAQSKSFWYFSFYAYRGAPHVVHALYLDLDHRESSDTAGDAAGYQVATIPAHRPEYALYVAQPSGDFTPADVAIYRRNGDAWAAPQTLADVGGSLYYSATAAYLELQIPNTAIGMDETTGSASVSLFSLAAAGGHAQDTVPSDPAVAYRTPDAGGETTTLSRFTAVSERLTLAAPPIVATGDPTSWPSVGPFAWHLPVEVYGTWWHGYQFQAAVDPLFTTVVWDYWMRFGGSIYAPPSHTHYEDLRGDNTYYWRVRPLYLPTGAPIDHRGAWSAAGRFERQGFAPVNLRTSVTFATPTFAWDMVEGAESYELQVSADPGFGSPVISATTTRTSYTPRDTLAQGAYYWRVRVRRQTNIANRWTASQTLTLTLPQPTGLTHDPAGVTPAVPTLCWTPLVVSAEGTPVLAAYKYRLQISPDPTFSTPTETTDTEQACWTPIKGYADGTYYWRVALVDGNGRTGDYSPAATFTKQYPAPVQVYPPPGSTLAETPTFIWQHVAGAARYKLETSLYPTFSPALETVTTNNASYTSPRRLAVGQTYHWRVAMVDKDGKQGPYAESTVSVAYADMQIFVAAPAIARPGETITYTLTYANMGQGPAEGVQVTDALPAGVASSQTLIWTIGHVGPGVIGSVAFTATLNSALPCGAVLTNVARVAAASAETDTTNNENRANTTVACPDLLLVKSGPYTARPGEAITYTLTYNNVGMGPAAAVRISDTLPAGVTSAGPLAWDLGTINAGATGARVIVATIGAGVRCGALLVNTAAIASSGGESDLSNNAAQWTTVVTCTSRPIYLPLVLARASAYTLR